MHGFDELNSVVGGYYRLLLGFTGLYWVLKSFLYRLSPGCTRYVNVFLNLIRFRVLKLFFLVMIPFLGSLMIFLAHRVGTEE